MRRTKFVTEVLEPRMLLSTYDAAKDFSLTQNPNGVWSYGVRFTETEPYAPFAAESSLDFGSGAAGWSENSGSPPYVGTNVTGAEYDSEGIDLPTGVLIMHPGGNGEYSDLRFTVPTSGTLNVAYTFTGIDTNGTTTDDHLLHNGSEISGGTINGFGKTVAKSIQVNAAQGDTLDLIVGPGDNGTFYSDATSLSLQISTDASQNHLVFIKQPTSVGVNQIVPFAVELENAKNKPALANGVADQVGVLVSTSSGAYAYDVLGLANSKYDSSKTVAGSTGVTIATPGTYTLTIYYGPGTDIGSTSSNLVSVVSKSFIVSGLHLAILKQPTTCGVGQVVPFSVEVENFKNKPALANGVGDQVGVLVSTSSGAYAYDVLSLSNSKYDSNKPVTGTTGLTIAAPGTYTLTVYYGPGTEIGSTSSNLASVVSKSFTVAGPHLVILKQPVACGVGEVVPFSVEVENFKNKPALASGVADQVGVLVSTSSGAYAYDVLGLSNSKYDSNKPVTGTTGLTIVAPGTYTLTIYYGPGTQIGSTSSNLASVVSKTFMVVTPHLVFKSQPPTGHTNTPLPFQIQLLDLHNKPVAPKSGFDRLMISLNTISASTAVADSAVFEFATGQFNNVLNGLQTPFQIRFSGTYTITATVESDSEIPNTVDFTPVTSKVFKIT